MPGDGVLVRMLFDGYADGSAFDRRRLLADATLNHTEFGYFGLSLWGLSPRWPYERVLAERCGVSRWVALYRVADLGELGLKVLPSGREPHFDVTVETVRIPPRHTAGSLNWTADDLVDRFLGAAYTGVRNGHFRAREL